MQRPTTEYVRNIIASKENVPVTTGDEIENLQDNRFLVKAIGMIALGMGLVMTVNMLKTGQDIGPAAITDIAAFSGMLTFAEGAPREVERISKQIEALEAENVNEFAA